MIACPAGSCSDIKDWSLGTELSVQRYFAYTAVANLNNYLHVLDYSLTTGGLISSLMAGDVVTVRNLGPLRNKPFTDSSLDLLRKPETASLIYANVQYRHTAHQHVLVSPQRFWRLWNSSWTFEVRISKLSHV